MPPERRPAKHSAGVAAGRVVPDVVTGLLSEFERIGYWNLRDEYRAVENPDGTLFMTTDLPTTTTTVTVAGRAKSVVDYQGTPAGLRALELTIDRVVNAKHWVSLDVPAVSELTRSGEDVGSAEAINLAYTAIIADDRDVVSALLDGGLNPNAQTPRLLTAARSAAIVELLVRKGANPNATSRSGVVKGITPLMSTARRGDPNTTRAWLMAGADVNAADSSGMTALMNAASWGQSRDGATPLASGRTLRC